MDMEYSPGWMAHGTKALIGMARKMGTELITTKMEENAKESGETEDCTERPP